MVKTNSIKYTGSWYTKRWRTIVGIFLLATFFNDAEGKCCTRLNRYFGRHKSKLRWLTLKSCLFGTPFILNYGIFYPSCVVSELFKRRCFDNVHSVLVAQRFTLKVLLRDVMFYFTTKLEYNKSGHSNSRLYRTYCLGRLRAFCFNIIILNLCLWIWLVCINCKPRQNSSHRTMCFTAP